MVDYDESCAFCKIIRGEAPAHVVCETEDSVAFFPLSPATRGHTLVTPRRHVKDIWSLDSRLGAQIFDTALLISHALKSALEPDGFNIINSAGEAASQTIYHLHIHLVPRWYDDRIGNIWPPKKSWSGEALDNLAEVVRAACAGLSLCAMLAIRIASPMASRKP